MFDGDDKTFQSTLTPGSPGFVAQKVVNDADKVIEKEQVLYQSRVGHYCISQNILDSILTIQCENYLGVVHCANHV